jgi:hypothetical protein
LRNRDPEYSTAIEYPQILKIVSKELGYTDEMDSEINIIKLN